MYTIKTNLTNNATINGIEFAGYASVFNVIDRHKDVIEKGAFIKTINNFGARYTSLLFKHDISQKVGIITMLCEDDHGLYLEGMIDISLPKSEELIRSIQNEAILHFSIGYYPKNIIKKGAINYINDLDLIEISFVESPANADAKILNVDGIYTDSKIANMLSCLG